MLTKMVFPEKAQKPRTSVVLVPFSWRLH